VAGWFVTGMLFYLHRDATLRHRGLLLAIAVVMLGMIWLPADPLIGRVLVDIFYTPGLAYGLFYICSKPGVTIEHTARTHDLSYGI
jgi:hypothetical protein